MVVRELVNRNGDMPGDNGGGAAAATAVMESSEDLLNRRGFGKAPPPPKKATDVEDESEDEEEQPQKGFPRGAPAQGISKDERMGRTEKGSVVEVLKQVRADALPAWCYSGDRMDGRTDGWVVCMHACIRLAGWTSSARTTDIRY